jgi:hypothetical protein
MKYSFEVLQNKKVPVAILHLCEFIDDVFGEVSDNASKPEWKKTKKYVTYGFYIGDGSPNLFFGLWLEYWEYSGFPLCITLQANDAESSIDEFKEFIRSKNEIFVKVLSYDDSPTAPFKIDYLESAKNFKLVANLMRELCDKLKI